MSTFYLASKSPRRRELLQRIGIGFDSVDVDIIERPAAHETALDYVQRIALDKATACRLQMSGTYPVLAADTEVILDGRILGKPADMEEAVQMLLSLAGREHQVCTAVVLLQDQAATLVSTSRVWFRPLSQQECRHYCTRFQPLDKAGAYGIQDLAAGFIHRFEGSYSGVMGLPLVETKILLGASGLG